MLRDSGGRGRISVQLTTLPVSVQWVRKEQFLASWLSSSKRNCNAP